MKNNNTRVNTRNLVLLCASALLVAGAVACDGGGGDKGGKSAGGDKAAAGGGDKKANSGEFVPGQQDKAVDTSKAKFKGAGEFMPRPDAWPKYKLTQGPDYYTKDTLFEIIDGGSEGYIAYGVVEMAKAVYKPAEGKFQEEVNIEVYRFKDVLGSFGKFGRERSSCADNAEVGDNWCLRQSDLIFWKGSNMVKVQTFDDSKEAEAAILEVARKVDSVIKDKAELPAIFAKFPKDKRIAGAGGFTPQEPFGFIGMKNTFIHAYKPDGDAYKGEDESVLLYAAELGSPDEATKVFESIKKDIEGRKEVKDKGGVKPVEGAGDKAFMYEDMLGTQTVFLKGKVIGGGRDFKDVPTAGTMTKALFEGF